MGHRRKLQDRLANRFRLEPGGAGDRDGGEHIGDVVGAAERYLICGQEPRFHGPLSPEQRAISHEGRGIAVRLSIGAEPDHPGRRFGSERAGDLVIEVQHSDVVSRLVLEDAQLERGVLLPRIAVQVVGRDVEDAGNVGALRRRLQLAMTELHHNPSLRRNAVQQAEEAGANVAADDMLFPARGEHLCDKGRRRGLAAAPGDTQQDARVQLQEEARHGADGHVVVAGRLDCGGGERYALRDEEEVSGDRILDPIFAQREAHGHSIQLSYPRGQGLWGLHIGDSYRGPLGR